MLKKGDIVSIDTKTAIDTDNWKYIGIADPMIKLIQDIDNNILENSFVVLYAGEDCSVNRNKYYHMRHISESTLGWNWYDNMVNKKRKNIFEDDSEFAL